jgi:hypothetical protein
MTYRLYSIAWSEIRAALPRTSADDFVAIAYVVIVITAAAAVVGADKGEGGLGHVEEQRLKQVIEGICRGC